MLEQWDQTRELTLFRAASRGLTDLIIHPTNFPALSGVQAAWLDCCFDLLHATASICVDVVRAPDLMSKNAYEIQAMRLYRAQLREHVQSLHGKPIAYAIWEVIDHYGGLQELHSVSGHRCTVCWRRYVRPAAVAFAAAGRWLRRTLPTALIQGEGPPIVHRAAACEQDPECLTTERAVQEAVEQLRPAVLQATEDAAGCPHCGSRRRQVALRWDLLEDPLRLQERPSRYGAIPTGPTMWRGRRMDGASPQPADQIGPRRSGMPTAGAS